MTPDERTLRTRALWILGGSIAPAIAFFVDAGMHVDPLIHEGELFGRGPGPAGGVGLRALAVYGLALVSVAGLIIHLATVDRRPGFAVVTVPLLGAGLLLALAHAIVFLPLLPLSAIGILFMGIGLLGFTPCIALWVYARAFSEAFRALAERFRGNVTPVAACVLASALPVAAAVAPVRYVETVVEAAVADMRATDADAVSRGFRRLGPFAGFARHDLAELYPRLDGRAQLRLRNLYLERFDRDIQEDAGWRARR